MPIKLGNKVRDSSSGYEGIAVSRTEWLHGCVRIGVDALEMKDGKPIDGVVFDEGRLELISETNMTQREPTGGPRPDPSRAPDVRR